MASQLNDDLSDDQKRVLFEKATEAPGSGSFLYKSDDGMYVCANCGAQLFNSKSKYDSKTPGLIGWPSFDKPVDGAVGEITDDSLGMQRTEVVCSNCSGHLGHVFPADDAETGIHYCINSASLDFKPSDGEKSND